MKIFTFSKKEILEEYNARIDKSDRILISIKSTVETPIPTELKNRYFDCLELSFDDLDFSTKELPKDSDFFGLNSFGEYEYQCLKNFTESHLKKFNGVVEIHCGEGVSRSGAVALSIAILKEDILLFMQIINDNKRIVPNKLVLSYFAGVCDFQ